MSADFITMTDAQEYVLENMQYAWGVPMGQVSADTGLPKKQCLMIARQFEQLGLASFGPWYDEDSSKIVGKGYSLGLQGAQCQKEMRRYSVRNPLADMLAHFPTP